MERAKVTPPAERPPMCKGTLLRSAKKKVHVYSKPSQYGQKSEAFGIIAKTETVMSLGEFASNGRKTFIHILTSTGPGWVRVGEVFAAEPNAAFVPPLEPLTKKEAQALKAMVLGDSFETRDIDTALEKLDAIIER